jgi:hypothetical protein
MRNNEELFIGDKLDCDGDLELIIDHIGGEELNTYLSKDAAIELIEKLEDVFNLSQEMP